MKRLALLMGAFWLISQVISLAQSAIPVLGWQTHFSYTHVKQVVVGSEAIFVATEQAIFSIDREELSLTKLNKLTGLSDVGIGAIGLLSDEKTLVIGYKNGNIDLVGPSSVRNINTVKNFQTTLSKKYHSIKAHNGNIYLAGDLGIIVYNLSRNEISEAYQNLGQNGSPLAIYDLHFDNDSIYAATADGLLSASLNNGTNRQDFNNWKRALTGIGFETIAETNDGLFAGSETDLFQKTSAGWQFTENFPSTIVRLEGTNEELWITTHDRVYQLNGSQLTQSVAVSASSGRVNYSAQNPPFIWLATSQKGLLRAIPSQSDFEQFMPAGPMGDTLHNGQFNQGKIAFNSSSFNNRVSGQGFIGEFDVETNLWANYSFIWNNEPIQNIVDVERIGETSYVVSFEHGLLEWTGVNDVSQPGTSAQAPQPNAQNEYRATAVTSDNNGLLWLTLHDRSPSLFSFNPSTNTWQSYTPPHDLARYAIDVFVGPTGLKWLTIDPDFGGGIVVYDDESGRSRHLNLNGGQGGLPSNEITSIYSDNDLFVWVTTSQGMAFFTNPGAVLNNQSLTASIPIYQNRLLLRNEYITDMVVDPANRKWFATRSNGLWLFSESGDELIYHFTINNSPLPSNHIVSLALAPQTGELFIATPLGMVSFRGDATLGTDRHEDVVAYPNPVKPGFEGSVVIEGLVNNAFLKITDVSGKLVKNLRANGSTAIWDVRDVNGTRVKTGVYLVFSTNELGTETYVTKIVVI
ncbi:MULTISPECIES: T9SS type A sorting domain-containing protein [unclassified Roseivirga]|uniref:type IX secretion system anionic LPS delivery protein PorZ n=1 Tax=unclassified Roseivirga TaxID=2626142 RepID=UPI00257B10AB|nr:MULTISPECIES: T9SS type A sorting domain-containing protein [unclassified Roseivirga]